MELPSVVKQIGRVEGSHLVYIEDYVYTYLKELKEEKSMLPYRVALFGKAGRRENKCYYFVYGAAGILEELEAGKSQEQVREEFFGDYDLIGYVNIYGNGKALPGKKDGYYVFYEANEPMQTYLLSRYERRQEERTDKPCVENPGIQERFWLGDILKKIFCGIGVIVLSIAVTSIDNYDKMDRFAELTVRAVQMTETKG